MSFYGTLYSEVINAIYRVLVSNKGKDTKNFPAKTDLASNTPLTAIGRQGILDIDSGNRWIQLTADSDKTKCNIWHAAPDSNATNNFTSFEKVSSLPEGKTSIDLSSGDIIKVSAPIKVDDAGHVASTIVDQYYKMPVSTIEADIEELKKNIGEFSEEYPDTTITDELIDIRKDVGDFEDVFKNVEVGDIENKDISTILAYLKQAVGQSSKVYPDYYLHSLSDAIGSMYAIFPNSNGTSSLSSGLGNLDQVFSSFDVDSVSGALLQIKNTMSTSSDDASNANICIGGIASNKPGEEKLGGSAYFIQKHPNTNIADILTDLQGRIVELEKQVTELKAK